jgi:MraZ protein
VNDFFMGYTGEFAYSVDSQRRIAIPRDWRSGEGDVFYLMPSPNKTLRVLNEAGFREMMETVTKGAMMDPKAQRALAILGSQMQRAVCDKQGRIALNPKLKDHAGIIDGAVLVGAIKEIQIWSKENWEAQQTDAAGIDDAFAILSQLGSQGPADRLASAVKEISR